MSNQLITTAEFRLVEDMQLPVTVYIKIAIVTNQTHGALSYMGAKFFKLPIAVSSEEKKIFYCKFDWPNRMIYDRDSKNKYVQAPVPLSTLHKLQRQARITVVNTLKDLGHETGEYGISTEFGKRTYTITGTLR